MHQLGEVVHRDRDRLKQTRMEAIKNDMLSCEVEEMDSYSRPQRLC